MSNNHPKLVVIPYWAMLVPFVVLAAGLALSAIAAANLLAQVAASKATAELCLPTARACNDQLIECLGYGNALIDRIERLQMTMAEGLGLLR